MKLTKSDLIPFLGEDHKREIKRHKPLFPKRKMNKSGADFAYCQRSGGQMAKRGRQGFGAISTDCVNEYTILYPIFFTCTVRKDGDFQSSSRVRKSHSWLHPSQETKVKRYKKLSCTGSGRRERDGYLMMPPFSVTIISLSGSCSFL